MKLSFLGAISALSFLALAAQAAPADQPANPTPDAPAIPYGTVTAEMTITTRGFATATATSDMYEAQAGELAKKRSQSPAVKAFAAQMIEAHTGTTRKLKALLASNHLVVSLPAKLDDRRQALIADLRSATADDFDHRYLAQQELAHEEAEMVMRGFSQDGDNAALKAFAADTLTVVQDHLAMIRKLETDQKTAP
jgi:putative membrane protein